MRATALFVVLVVLTGSTSTCGGATGTGGGDDADGRAIEIAATGGWQNTDIAPGPGTTLIISKVTGRITDRETSIEGGGGSDDVCGTADCCEPMPNVRRSALIGRIGGITFVIGEGGSFPVTSEGSLELRLNDCDAGLADNSGTLKMRIGVQP